MRLKVAHHFWQNNENATWSPSAFPLPEIEVEIKHQYERLQTERPQWKTFGNVCVFFDYRPGKDIFGRTIVPISFAFLSNCKNPSRSAAAILPVLAQTPHSVTEVEVDLPWEKTLLRSRSALLHRLPMLLLPILLLLAGLLWMALPSAPEDTQTPVPETAPHKKTAADKSQKNLPSPHTDPSVTKPQLTAPRQIETLCLREDLINGLYLCPSVYVQQMCLNNGPVLAFDTWLEKTTDTRCDTWKRSTFKQYTKKDISLSKHDKQLLDEFFKHQMR